MTKCVSILGSTGSIGRQSLEVIAALGLSVGALTANRSVDLLEQQARQFRPKLVAVMDEKNAETLQERLADMDIRVVSGMDGLVEAATLDDVDTVVTSVVGNVGLKPLPLSYPH